ncbi:uncharacterized protein LOC135956985 [Calliphora vicina]|uniref:uncharacterized protein LOC135956985 n=1 Tax=Calliphora vicina TaxID=7373 RepID=UPI00325A4BB0
MTTNQSELQTNKRPGKVITTQEKLAILKELQTGTPRREVEQMFNCSQSTISRVLLFKDTLQLETQGNATNKRESTINYKELDQALTLWAREMEMSNVMITADMAKQKVEELLRAMGYDQKPSTAWLYKWKARENIQFGKKTKGPEEILKEFLDKRENWHDKELAEEKNTQNESIQDNLEDSQNKSRTKREYTKRLPIMDASGVIYRSRKEKTFLTLLQKLEILQRLKNGERRSDMIIEYKLSQSAMSQIVTDEEKILKLAAGGQNLQMKRIRGGIFKGGEAELNAWVREKMEKGESLTRTQIKNRAKEIAERLKIDFKASTGWLEKWKARMNMDFNVNQILERKIPNYLTTEKEFENGLEQCEQPDIVMDQHSDNGDYLQQHIKEENDDYDEDMETQDEFCSDDMYEADVKPELLTPQEFYLQTIKANSHNSQESNEATTEQRQEAVEEPDIKPFIGTPPHLGQSEATAPSLEILHEQVLQWLNRYNIPPLAASELLDILQPHLNTVTSTSPQPVQQNQEYF